ncbi:MAG: transporter substrate-binding domain-containing protein [Planctomycetes bacterium]|nr:transporter substrate-binding domain-containing protein [Planctomycetota bacterium]
MKRILSVFVVAILIATVLGIFGRFMNPEEKIPVDSGTNQTDNTDESGKRKLIIVGEEWAPFEYEKDGVVTGIDQEVLTHIFGEMGVEFEIRLYPWSRAYWMAQNGKADAVISVSYNKEREEFLLYTEDQKQFATTGKWPENHLWKSEYYFFCKAVLRNAIKFESYDQIIRDGYKVITIQDYSYHKPFLTLLPKMEKLVVSDSATGFEMLYNAKGDLFPQDITVGMATLKLMGYDRKISYINKPMFKKPYLIPFCVKSDYPEKEKIMAELYRKLDEMRKSGEYSAIYDKYTKNLKGQ